MDLQILFVSFSVLEIQKHATVVLAENTVIRIMQDESNHVEINTFTKIHERA